jgi:hypothetical protein
VTKIYYNAIEIKMVALQPPMMEYFLSQAKKKYGEVLR